MHVCLLSGSFPTVRCGVADQVWHLARHLASLGDDVTVITSRNERTREGAAEIADTGVRALPVIGSWITPDPLLAAVASAACSVLQLEYQTGLYQRHPMINRLPTTLAEAGLDLPVITRFHDLWGPRLFPGAGRLGLRTPHVVSLARTSRMALVSNERHRQELLGLLSGEGENVATFPLGPGVPPCGPPSESGRIRAELGLTDRDVLVAHFGLIQSGTGKGVEQLLKALAAIRRPNVHLVVIGGAHNPKDLRHEQRLRALIGELDLGMRVHWTGFVAPERASAVLQVCDLCVLPFDDGASRHRSSLITALAHRLPLVTTVGPHPPTGLTEGVHFLTTRVGDAEGLARRVTELIDNVALREQLRVNLEPVAREHSWPEIAQRAHLLYEWALTR